MAYNYDDEIPVWQNEGTEPVDSVKTEGYKAGYKPPAAYFNWFWSHTLQWLRDLRTKLSSLHTQVQSVEEKVTTLEGKDYSVSANDVLTKIKTVDGTGSGLDADKLDGLDSTDFALVDHTHTQYAGVSHNHAVATETSNGFLSAEDKAKLNKLDPDSISDYTHPATHPASMITGLADVATSGNYADLINTPILSGVATSGSYNDLLDKPAAYTHPSTHPADMITETTNIKMMTAAERTKLANIVANANYYVHPSTHPADMITGLEAYISSLGYGKIATGSYIGDGTCKQDETYYNTADKFKANARKITLPFAPSCLLIFPKQGSFDLFAVHPNTVYKAQNDEYGDGTSQSVCRYLEGNIFYCDATKYLYKSKGISGFTDYLGCNASGYTYMWMAF